MGRNALAARFYGLLGGSLQNPFLPTPQTGQEVKKRDDLSIDTTLGGKGNV